MANIVTAYGTSHAFTLMPPGEWDAFRKKNQAGFHRRYGTTPADHPRVAAEDDASNAVRYERISEALDRIALSLERARPDALILIADDQNENLSRANLPQVAIYTGDNFLIANDPIDERRSSPELAAAILRHAVESDIDMAELHSFPDRLLFAHAYGPVLKRIDPSGAMPVVPVFINEIHVPAPSPARCYYVGVTIAEAVHAFSGLRSVSVLASGGLSHFTAGYPWTHYAGPHRHGSIDEAFDARIVGQIRTGHGKELTALSSADLLASGAIELRAWIAMLGSIGPAKPVDFVYEPFYRGIMGMGVARWELLV